MKNFSGTKALGIPLSLLFALNSYAALDGYIGKQSFDLKDDRQFKQHERTVDQVKRELDAKLAEVKSQEQVVSKWQDQIKKTNDEISRKNADVKNLQNQIAELQQKNKTLKETLDTAETEEQKKQLKDQIAANKQQIEAKKASQQSIQTEAEALKTKLAGQQTSLTNEKNLLAAKNQQAEQARENKRKAVAERDDYEQKLIAKILEANRSGAQEGRDDGQADGLRLAKDLGIEDGYSDGKIDGRSDGIRAGERRDYSLGHDEGNKIGIAEGTEQGEIDGTKEGTVSGNTIAARREGTAAGEDRAEKSDASQVGTAQGKKAGYDRAVSTGKRVGTEKGESQAIEQYEKATLNKVKIAGQFAAAFDKNVPSYPGPSNHSYSTYEANKYQREVVRKAYIDGYDFRYHNASRNQFENNIDDIYNDAYQDAHEKTYFNFYNQFYQESFADGKKDGEREGYNAIYPGVKEEYFDKYESLFSQNPNRQASEYLSTYKTKELEAYKRHYEEIRSDYFDQFEASTFAANIGEQTEKYRVLRFDQVDSIYKKSAVLSFVSSQMLDAGIRGIAKNDGIFQPEETTLHTITVKNYGLVEAKGVVAKLDSGEKVVLPTIPAQSQTTIEHALSGNVGNLAEDSILSRSLSLSYPLSEEERIQGRHYDSLKGGILTSGDVKRETVRYPLLLTGLSTTQQLIKDAITPITLTVNNRSNRSYTGPLTLHLVSSKPSVINTPFATIQSLGSSAPSKNATLLVTNNSDIYTPMSFSATVTQNGVLLGRVDRTFSTMAKSKFIDKVGTPILLANSDASYASLLDLINEFGGIEKVSILDTSLRSLNAAALTQSFANRLAVVLPKSGVMAEASNLVKGAQNLVMLVLGDQSAQNELTSHSVFTDKFSVNYDVKDLGEKTIVSSNHHRVAGLQGSTTILTASERNYEDELSLAQALAMPTDALIAKIDQDVDTSDFFSLRSNQSTLISALHIKSLMELGTINIAYDLSKKPGLFGSMLFGKRDKKWIEMIEKDQNLAISKIASYVDRTLARKQVTSSLLAAYQNSYTVENALKNFRPISKDIISDVESAATKIVKKTRDALTKGLKALNRTLYNKVDDEKFLYTPFEPGTDYGCIPGNPNFPGCQNGH